LVCFKVKLVQLDYNPEFVYSKDGLKTRLQLENVLQEYVQLTHILEFNGVDVQLLLLLPLADD